MDRKILLTALIALLVTGCTWSEASKLSFQKECENSTEFYRRAITFDGFNQHDLASIKVVETNAQQQTLGTTVFSLSDTSYWYGSGQYRVELPLHNFNTENSYDFVFNDGSTHRLHDMKQSMVPHFSMYSEHYVCEMTDYWVNDHHYQGFGGIVLQKHSSN